MNTLSIVTVSLTVAATLVYLLAAIKIYAALHSHRHRDRNDTNGDHSQEAATSTSVAWRLGFIAAGLHALTIVFQGIAYQAISSSFYDALSITSWLVVSMALATQSKQSITVLLLPVYLIAAICLPLSVFLGHHTPITADSQGMLTHILSSIIAYSLLSLATVHAVALYLLDRGLRQPTHQQWWLRQLPPLQTLESILFQLIFAGWAVLTVALISGGIYVDDLFAQYLVHKTVFSFLSWLLFAVLLLGRKYYGWRGTTAVKWTIAAFIALALGYFGSKFVLEIILQRS